jgi:Golgin subfamily A member 7/ERF4 family
VCVCVCVFFFHFFFFLSVVCDDQGLFPSYDEHFPHELQGIVGRKEFQESIEAVNDSLEGFWPCGLCQGLGFGCALCTLGLSCLLPGMCVQDARRYAQHKIDDINYTYRREGIRARWRLERSYVFVRLRIVVYANPGPYD